MGESLKIDFKDGAKETFIPVKPKTTVDKDMPDPDESFSKNSLEVLNRRYLRRDKDGAVTETVKELFQRVARSVAEADLQYSSKQTVQRTVKKFYEMMVKRDFIPNSPTLMNAGHSLGQLSACFVLPVFDSMESIFQTLKDTALIHKSGGGTGFSFSNIRPKNSIVKSTCGVASGPVSFMKVYNAATEAVKQGGTRRGANMGILRVDHPDILEFINCKKENADITNFNISVAVTDEFMEKVRKREHYELINPLDGNIEGTLNAAEVFDLIAANAWGNGDPGVVFIDRINKYNPTPDLGDIEATNPCGEQPLLPYESCNLGSINLANFISDGSVNYDYLGKTIDNAIHFLDNVIDVNKYPLKKIVKVVRQTRKIGLGIMGFADVLYNLGIPYDSDEALEFADKLMEFMYNHAREASIKLAKSRGTFPVWNNSIYFPDGPKLRNSTFMTIAPTGTISMIADCSSGIEPVFSLVFTKRVMDGSNFLYVNPSFEKACKKAGIYSDELMAKVSESGSIQDIEEIPEEIRKVFVTAHDIDPEWHVRMQAAFQKWVDDAVSKTCNFAKNASVQDVLDAYWLAYEAGCKGITIYRDGSRVEQVLYIGDKSSESKSESKESQYLIHHGSPLHPRIRPTETVGVTKRIRTGEGTLYITINEDADGLCEVFTNIGKAGSQAQVESEAISRLISLALRSGIDTRDIIKQLRGIGGPTPIWENGTQILSTPDAIAKALEIYLDEREGKKKSPRSEPSFSLYDSSTNLKEETAKPKQAPKNSQSSTKKTLITCPDCGSTVYHESGCVTCPVCGYSKC